MYIIELNYPGSHLKFDDGNSKQELISLFHFIEGSVITAAISLSMFESSQPTMHDSMTEWDRDSKLRSQVDEELRQEAGELYYKNFNEYQIISENRLRQAKAKLGILPRSYVHKIPFIHAHTFVYAVDSFGKILEEITTYNGIPEGIQNCLDEFNRALPSVRKIRNSALHIEDRSRGYGSLKEKKQSKKMEANGFLGLSNLEDNFLCYTIDDGSYQKVEISLIILDTLVQITNNLLACFEWEGKPHVAPHY